MKCSGDGTTAWGRSLQLEAGEDLTWILTVQRAEQRTGWHQSQPLSECSAGRHGGRVSETPKLCDKRPTVDGDRANTGGTWGRVGWGGWPKQFENKEELKVFGASMSSKPCGDLATAFILACYSLGHKGLSTSYYSNNSPHVRMEMGKSSLLK